MEMTQINNSKPEHLAERDVNSELYGLRKELYENANTHRFIYQAGKQRNVHLVYKRSTVSGSEFKMSKDTHLLFDSTLEYQLPAISVKEQYHANTRVSWISNIGHHLATNYYLIVTGTKEGEKQIQAITSYAMDDLSCNRKDQDNYMYMIGNRTSLVDPSKELPSETIIVPQPFYYCDFPLNCFHVYMLDSDKHLYRRYEFQDDIRQLLIMEERDEEGAWTFIKPDLDRLNYSAINRPTMIDKVGFLSRNDLQYLEQQPSVEQYFYDPISICNDEVTVPGRSCSIDIDLESPLSELYWRGITHHDQDMNLYANSNKEAISQSTLIYDRNIRHCTLDQVFTERYTKMESGYAAFDGYHYLNFGLLPRSHNVDYTDRVKNRSVNLKVKVPSSNDESDIMSVATSARTDDTKTYMFRVVAVVRNKLVISKDSVTVLTD